MDEDDIPIYNSTVNGISVVTHDLANICVLSFEESTDALGKIWCDEKTVGEFRITMYK